VGFPQRILIERQDDEIAMRGYIANRATGDDSVLCQWKNCSGHRAEQNKASSNEKPMKHGEVSMQVGLHANAV